MFSLPSISCWLHQKLILIASFGLIMSFVLAGCSHNQQKPQSYSDDLNNALNTTVKIETYSTPPLGDIANFSSENSPINSSRGFIVEEDGHILTSYTSLLDSKQHSLANGIIVTLYNSTPNNPTPNNATPTNTTHNKTKSNKAPQNIFSAQIVAIEPTLNFAVLKINADRPLNTASIITREAIQNKKQLYTLGGFDKASPNFIVGKLKHLNAKECYQESMTSTMFEAKMALTDSLMGSPIFNANGDVVAMHTGYFPALGEHFDKDDEYLLPIFLAFNIYDSIKKRQSYISPWTGFSVRPLTDTEKALFPFQKNQGGIAIEYVWPGSPAEKLGIRVNDILVKFSFYPTPSPAEFQKWLYLHGVGADVDLQIIRNKKNLIKLPYKIEPRPEWAVPK